MNERLFNEDYRDMILCLQSEAQTLEKLKEQKRNG